MGIGKCHRALISNRIHRLYLYPVAFPVGKDARDQT